MIYVMSDIHGEYEKYIKMLELIGFSDDDTLFVLGDVVDRGKEPVKVLKDMMARSNVYPIMGNHDYMALTILEKLAVEITAENCTEQVDISVMNMLLDWLNEGGSTTIEAFRKCSNKERADILDYLAEFSLYETLDIGDRTFILVHAGLGNFRKDKKLSEYTPYELMMMRSDPDAEYFEDKSICIVTGHTPTVHFTGRHEIYTSGSNICIDCGACHENGKLACLCLDTMQAFYIGSEEETGLD